MMDAAKTCWALTLQSVGGTFPVSCPILVPGCRLAFPSPPECSLCPRCVERLGLPSPSAACKKRYWIFNDPNIIKQ